MSGIATIRAFSDYLGGKMFAAKILQDAQDFLKVSVGNSLVAIAVLPVVTIQHPVDRDELLLDGTVDFGGGPVN